MATTHRDFSYMRLAVSVSATLWFMITARGVLQPFLIALFTWFLLNATARAFERALGGLSVDAPRLARILSAATLLSTVLLFGMMVSSSAEEIAQNLPFYEQRLNDLIASVSTSMGLEQSIAVTEQLDRIEVVPALLGLLGSAADLITAIVIIVVYMIFIGQEARTASWKLGRIAKDKDTRAMVLSCSERILDDIEIYVGIKVVLGLVQSVPTFIVLTMVGVDAAIFWAFVVFAFSFIPTIGTMIGIVFPAVATLVQFNTFGPFLVVLAALVPVQLLASNYLEPRLMGDRLNLSPLVVFLGIFAAGAIWGIVGALIVVPILTMTVIVFSQIPSLQPVAILMSGVENEEMN